MGQRSHLASNVANVCRRPISCPIRDDLRALEGYHSAQVDVDVRLNTNESPFPPPPGWREELAGALAAIEWHRYPDRSAAGLRAAIAAWHGVAPGQVFAANGSNEVLQTLLLTYAGPGRSVLTFEPTYQLHGHIARITGATVVEAERDADFRLVAGRRRRGRRASTGPAVTFLCSPNNPTGIVEDPAVVRGRARRVATGSSSSTRPTPSSPAGAPSTSSPRTARSSSCARSPRRGAWRRPGSATSSGRRGWSGTSTTSCCRTTSTRPSRSPARWRCATSTRWTSA